MENMKRILCSLCIGSTIVALSASGAFADRADQKGKGKGKRGNPSAQAASSGQSRGAIARGGGGRGQTQRNVRAQSRIQRAPAVVQRRSGMRSRDRAAARNRRSVARAETQAAPRQRQLARGQRRAVREARQARRDQTIARQDVNVARERQGRQLRKQLRTERRFVGDRDRRFRGDRAWRNIRDRDIKIVNTWRDNRFAGQRYRAFRDYRRVYRDRGWYHHHYSSIIFVMGGWWYWNAGYWYPAWGYAPASTYVYDGPIYTGSVALSPDHIVVQVQRELLREGYDPGPIDGVLGPSTRRALAAFQADNGLAITSAIDEPTLASLGMT